MKTILGCVALAVAAICPLSQAEEAAPSELEVQRLNAALSVIRSNTRISNPTIVHYQGPQLSLLVDTGVEPVAERLGEYLQGLPATERSVVVTSHGHRDHTENLRQVPLRYLLMTSPEQYAALLAGGYVDDTRQFGPVSGTVTLRDGDEIIDVMTLPEKQGHTLGDVAVHWHSANAIYLGDHGFYVGFPIIDVANGGNLRNYIRNGRFLLGLGNDETTYIPGHSTFAPEPIRLWSHDEYRAWLDRIEASANWIASQRAGGVNVEALQQDQEHQSRFDLHAGIPTFVSWDRWVKFCYEHDAA
jgi:glyoxylase-like metal-dependent hydrolase (beta-lactamase superfamily II)